LCRFFGRGGDFETSHFARRVRARNYRSAIACYAGHGSQSCFSGKAGRSSECESFQSLILEKLEQELSVQRIYQDLTIEHGFTGSYDGVKRFVRQMGRSRPLPMRRMEYAAGEEAQVDFGSGAPVVGADGKRRKTHVFRIVLSHSRKAYSEATFRQTTEDFIGCLENAFASFGGLPQVLVIDNLRAAVKHPDWFDPELVPKLRSFCQHYGVVILPTKPYMPRHKGKVEAGVKYMQKNALKARKFGSLQEENEYLSRWGATVADRPMEVIVYQGFPEALLRCPMEWHNKTAPDP